MRIVSDDVILRDMTESDIPDYVRWFTEETRWGDLDAPWEPIASDEESEKNSWSEYYARVKDRPEDAPRWKFEIEWNGRHIGWVSSYDIDEAFEWTDKGSDRLAVGIDICEPEAWGRGVGAKALSAFIGYLFERGEERVYTQTWSGNERMVRCAKKLGFTECDRRAALREVDGKRFDALTFVLQRGQKPIC
ncbi:MAG: GNAT family N-acetyltransferase [Clostridia bacterium]|nr:GNAT family N-acetyltransferase [Clostridia bacterium]